MKTRETIVALFIAAAGVAFVGLDFKGIQFEYYTWNLSSENLDTRESNAQKIIQMGDYAVPLLIKKINKQFIFETDLEIYCLEEITKTETSYDKKHFNLNSEAIPFWNEWWLKNKQKYN